MIKGFYKSILGIFVLLALYATGNIALILFGDITFDTRNLLLLILVNTLIMGAWLYLGFFFSMRAVRNYVKKADLNSILYDLIQRTAHHKNSSEMYRDLLSTAVKTIPDSTKGSLILLDEKTGILKFAAAVGYDWTILKSTYLKLEETYLFRESKGNITKSVIIDDPFGYDRRNISSGNVATILSAGSDNVMSTISTPLYFNGKLHGMMNVDSNKRFNYTKEDVNTLEIFAYEITNVLRLYNTLERNKYLYSHDNLTDLFNRKHVDEVVRPKFDGSLEGCLVSIDLNHLKGINDTYGHSAGDELLIKFAEGFTKHIPNEACLARYGGDEFILFIEGASHDSIIQLLLKVKRWFIDNPLMIGDKAIPVDFSYGITHFPNEADTFDRVLLLADQRMYDQKRLHHGLRRKTDRKPEQVQSSLDDSTCKEALQ